MTCPLRIHEPEESGQASLTTRPGNLGTYILIPAPPAPAAWAGGNPCTREPIGSSLLGNSGRPHHAVARLHSIYSDTDKGTSPLFLQRPPGVGEDFADVVDFGEQAAERPARLWILALCPMSAKGINKLL